MSTTTIQLPSTPIRIKKVQLWRREIPAHPDAFAEAISLLTAGGVGLPVILRYRHPTDAQRAYIEVYPQPLDNDDTWAGYLHGVGFAPRHVPVLLIEGGYPIGDGQSLTNIIAALKVNIMFLATQVIDGKYGATIGFETDADAEKAVATLMSRIIEVQEKGTSLPVNNFTLRRDDIGYGHNGPTKMLAF